MLGASPPESPASIQTAAITGAAAANSLRVAGGTATRGISERSAPGARVTVSGDRATTTIPRIVTMVRTTKMMAFAAVVSWIARPASREPSAETAGQADAAEDRAQSLPVRRREFDERRGEGGRRRAAGNALHDAAGDHPADVGGDEEHDVRCELDDQCADQHRAPADVVGERPQREDGGEEADRVDGERQREKRRREAPTAPCRPRAAASAHPPRDTGS